MKRHIIIMYMLLIFLSGCSGRSAGWQTGNVTLVRAVEVGLAQTGITLTAWAGSEERPLVLTVDGASVAAGMQKLQEMGESFIHFGHADQLLMGEAFAGNEAAQLVDFVARDRRIGPGARLWVLRDETAERTVVAGGESVAARLERLAGDREAGARLDCSVTRLMSAMASEDSVPIPALRREQGVLRSAGYAVLRQGRLVGFLDGEQSLGLELLCGQGVGQMVDVTLAEGTHLVLSVKRADVRCVPWLDADGMNGASLCSSVRFEVAQGAPMTAMQRQGATGQAEEVLCRRMAAALACAQFWDADFVGVERLTRMACSAQEWKGVDWERDFRTLPLQVMVSAEINWPADMAEE